MSVVTTESCTEQATNLAVEEFDMSQGSASLPITQLVCNAQPCLKYFWQTGTWGECSKSCSGGVQVRAVRCVEYTTAVVEDSLCEATATLPKKPAATVSCNEQSCASYGWRQGSWCTSQLPATGTALLPATSLVSLRRNITCVDEAGQAISDIFCRNKTDVAVPQTLFSCSSACAISSYLSDDLPVANRRKQSSCTNAKQDATAVVACLVSSFQEQLAAKNTVGDLCPSACHSLFYATYEQCIGPSVPLLVDPDIAVPLAAARSLCTAATTESYCASPDAVRCFQECTPCATGSDRTTSGVQCSTACDRCILYLPCTLSGWAKQSATQAASNLVGTWYVRQMVASTQAACYRLHFQNNDLSWSTQVTMVADGADCATAPTGVRVTASERFGMLNVWQGRECDQGCMVDMLLYRKDGSKIVFDLLVPGILWLSNSSAATAPPQARRLTLLTLKEDCARDAGCMSQTPRPTADDRTKYSELYDLFEYQPQPQQVGVSVVTAAAASAQNFKDLLPHANVLAACTTPKGDCVFPFLYNGIEYHTCSATGDSRPPWCFVGSRTGPEWSLCRPECLPPAISNVALNFTMGKPQAFGTVMFPAGVYVAEPSSWLMISTGDVTTAFESDNSPASFDFPPEGASGDRIVVEITFFASVLIESLGFDYIFATAEPLASGMLSPELTDSVAIEVNGQLRSYLGDGKNLSIGNLAPNGGVRASWHRDLIYESEANFPARTRVLTLTMRPQLGLNTIKITLQDGGSATSSSGLLDSAVLLRQHSFRMYPRASWLVMGDWSGCDETCVKTRPVQCDENGKPIGESFCDETLKPQSRMACGGGLCRMYAYRLGEWSACSCSASGIVTRSRLRFCVDPAGALAPLGSCPSLPPPVEEACGKADTTSAPCVQYQWIEYISGECSVTCGGGIRKREMRCMDAAYREGDSLLCELPIPADTVVCNAFSCSLPMYQPVVGAWSACSVSCGGGVRSRSVQCVNRYRPTNAITAETAALWHATPKSAHFYPTLERVSHGRSHGVSRLFLHRDGERVDDTRCRAAELPLGNCSQQPCSGYSWATGEWCTAHIANPCAPIVLQREAKCTDAARNVVPEFLCTGAVPETQKSFTCDGPSDRPTALTASPQHALLAPSVRPRSSCAGARRQQGQSRRRRGVRVSTAAHNRR
jgi:hypothetical protein